MEVAQFRQENLR